MWLSFHYDCLHLLSASSKEARACKYENDSKCRHGFQKLPVGLTNWRCVRICDVIVADRLRLAKVRECTWAQLGSKPEADMWGGRPQWLWAGKVRKCWHICRYTWGPIRQKMAWKFYVSEQLDTKSDSNMSKLKPNGLNYFCSIESTPCAKSPGPRPPSRISSRTTCYNESQLQKLLT